MKNFKKSIGKANILLASLALGIGLVLPTQSAHADSGDHSGAECVAGVAGEATIGATTLGLAGAKVGTVTLPGGGTVAGSAVGAIGGGIGGAIKGAADHCF